MDEQKRTPKEEIVKKSKRRTIWKRIVSALACVVVFCTTYALILPAITMTKSTFCGIEEHVHGDGCYTTNLICQIDTDISNTDEKNSGDINADSAVHVHTETCYKQESKLICTIQETEGHTHTDNCKSKTKECICGLEENDTHVHADSCYKEMENITCGLTEEQAHIHGTSCYENIDILICEESKENQIAEQSAIQETADGNAGIETVSAAHTHTESCYEKVLACGKEEHTHVKMCYSDKTADVETAADWEATLPKETEMTGDWRKDLLTVAKSQLGYEESTKNYEVTSSGDVKGYTRYGDWYGDTYGDWCAMYVSFCLEYAGVYEAAMPQDANCQNWINTLKKDAYQLYHEVSSAYLPQAGDLIFFEWGDGDKNADHIGIVVEVDTDASGKVAKVKTIEGNSGDKVRYREYDGDDGQILGYGELPATGASVTQEEIEFAKVQKIITLIEALPLYEEVDAKLTEFDELGDLVGYEDYYKRIQEQVLTVYVQYEDLSVELKEQVTNAEKLMEWQWMWSASLMTITEDIPIYQLNTFDQFGTGNQKSVLFYGKSADEHGCDFSFSWWSAIIVDQNEEGDFVVSEVITTGEVDKSAYGPSTENGFIIYVWHGEISIANLDVQVGDYAVISFDHSQTTAYTGTSLGTIKFVKDNSSKLTIVEGADTDELIEVNLYDYNSLINTLYNVDNNYPGFQQDKGTTINITSLNGITFNFGNNITKDLDAGESSVTTVGGTNINATTGKDTYGTANVPIEGMMLPILKNDYPALADGTSLDYLFKTNTYSTKKNTESINGLFLHNDITGAYTFNSRENHAQYNSKNDTFTLYEQLISSNYMMYPFGNFLPFNDIETQCAQTAEIDRTYMQAMAQSAQYKYDAGMGDEYNTLATRLNQFISLMDASYGTTWKSSDAMNEYFEVSGIPARFSQDDEILKKVYSIDYDEATDFYFGMEMKMEFMQPKGGMTGNDTNQDGQSDYPMEFYFTGDDDVWVYMDDVLFLDLSGIHRHVGGEIDFVNGLVHYYYLSKETGDVSTEPYKTKTFAEILTAAGKDTSVLNEKGTFVDYSMHSFNFYYMERGAGSGVCRMNFNFPLIRKNTVSVAKELTVDDETVLPLLGNPDFKFQILKADENGNKTEELFVPPNTSYTLYDRNNKVIEGTYQTDVNGIFTLKAGQRAEFSGIDENEGKYYVRELLDSTMVDQYGQITVAGNSVTISHDIQVGGDSFTGAITNVKDISDGTTLFNFNNNVTTNKLGNLQITKSLVSSIDPEQNHQFEFYVTFDGNPIPIGTTYYVGEQTKTVQVEGIISIAANETAIIPKILAGSEFTVSETSASAKGYTVIYSGSAGVETDGEKASGIISTESTVEVTVTNTENGANVIVTGVKNVINPDTTERTVTFKLEEVTDKTGSTKVENGLEMTTSTNVAETAEFSFNLSYLEKNLEELPVVYYYKITESSSADGESQKEEFKLDETFYIVEVTVDKVDGTLQAAVTNRWKNGELSLTDTDVIAFSNVLLKNLVLEKIVSGIETTDKFPFEIILTDSQGNPLTGSYKVLASDDSMDEIMLDNEGKATVSLGHKESITIKGLPNGAKWTITETVQDGYISSIVIGEADAVEKNSASGDVADGSNHITFTNTATYELPETGGFGVNPYIIGGTMMMILSGFFLLYKNNKRGKEDY